MVRKRHSSAFGSPSVVPICPRIRHHAAPVLGAVAGGSRAFSSHDRWMASLRISLRLAHAFIVWAHSGGDVRAWLGHSGSDGSVVRSCEAAFAFRGSRTLPSPGGVGVDRQVGARPGWPDARSGCPPRLLASVLGGLEAGSSVADRRVAAPRRRASTRLRPVACRWPVERGGDERANGGVSTGPSRIPALAETGGARSGSA
jgi:hypothetical protein